MAEQFLLEFARCPTPGRVKTRLARTEGVVEAARLYALLARRVHADLLRQQQLGVADVALCLALEPGEALAQPPWLPGARHLWAQCGGDLGLRMTHALDRAFASGAQRAIVVGTDVVGLDEEHVGRAFAALRSHDLVLSPTPDGGFGLIGVRAPPRSLLRDLPWSQPHTCAATLQRAQSLGLAVKTQFGLRDVDRAQDLEGVVPWVSILIPALNESRQLGQNLLPLMEQVQAVAPHVEVVLADGGSTDDGVALARTLGLQVVRGVPGRGTQLRAAAEHAQGRWLWTLHADALVAPGALEAVLDFARRGHPRWGWCPVRTDHPSRWLAAFLTLTEGRARIFRLPYGDQGLLVRRSIYDHVGGYRPIALMEDVELSLALAAHGTPARVATRLTISGRRWAQGGVGRTTLRNLSTLARYLCLRADPADLARTYVRGVRAT